MICIGAIVAAITYTHIAHAHPDGAPWGAASPSASESCASCHFDNEPIHDSTRLRIEGLPREPNPGETYELIISFDQPDAVVVGFQLTAQAEEDQAGTFVSSAANVEFIGPAIRSTTPVKNSETVSWVLQWQVPAKFTPPVTLYVAASAANDDGSPLGDQIHFRSYRLPPEQPNRHR